RATEGVEGRRRSDTGGARRDLHRGGVVAAGEALLHRHLEQRLRPVVLAPNPPPGLRAHGRHRPSKVGRRFSRNAATAPAWSDVVASRACAAASAASTSGSGAVAPNRTARRTSA